MTGAVTRVSELTSAGGEVAPADLRRWLQGFAEVSSQHGAMMRVWTDAGRTDDLLQSSGPGAFDWGRRQMAASLASRAYGDRSEEHTSELQTLMRISHAFFC